jgi:hypothetical protein
MLFEEEHPGFYRSPRIVRTSEQSVEDSTGNFENSQF